MNGYLVTIGKFVTLGLRPPRVPDDDADPQQVKVYRVAKHEWCYAMALAVIGSFLLSMLIALPLMGWLPVHWNQVAWSQDIATSEGTQDGKLREVTSRLDKLENTVAAQVTATNFVLLEITEKDLDEMNRRRCTAATPNDQDYWQRQMNRAKPRYAVYSGGVPYEQRRCRKS